MLLADKCQLSPQMHDTVSRCLIEMSVINVTSVQDIQLLSFSLTFFLLCVFLLHTVTIPAHMKWLYTWLITINESSVWALSLATCKSIRGPIGGTCGSKDGGRSFSVAKSANFAFFSNHMWPAMQFFWSSNHLNSNQFRQCFKMLQDGSDVLRPGSWRTLIAFYLFYCYIYMFQTFKHSWSHKNLYICSLSFSPLSFLFIAGTL